MVTGVAGFIGFHLARELLEAGHAIRGIDNLDPYYSLALKEDRLQILAGYPNFSFNLCDISQGDSIEVEVEKFEPDSIFHMAAQAGVRLRTEDYGKYVESNLVAFSKIAIAAKIHRVEKLIYASSSSVYGNLDKKSFSEYEGNLSPVSFYGATKLSNEILASGIFSGEQTKSRGLRFFTVYGEYGRPDMAYFRILSSLLNNEPFEVFGDGEDLRDFTYVADVVQAIVALNSELDTREPGFTDVVNIGGGNPRSLNEMIHIMEKITNNKINKTKGKKIHADVNKTVADNSYIEGLLGSVPSTSLEVGLEKFVSWGESNLQHFPKK